MHRHAEKETWLDIVSHARPGPRSDLRLTALTIESIGRTIARTPEVMVKVSGGSKSLSRALAHFRYIDREGQLAIETDEGKTLKGRGVENELLEDWDLELAAAEGRSPYRGHAGRKPEKLTHHIVLSMPAGTHPGGVLAASRVFAREQFGLQYRYALVLHTDQAHPHVHLVVKALGEDGKRLNIRKATLRGWRQEFARQLRLQRIPANATDRFVRGQTPKALRDGIYRASQRGESRHLRASTADAAARERLQGMRERLFQGWGSAADVVRDRGQWLLADRMVRFAQELPPVRTDQEFWTKRDRSKPIVHRERVEALTR